VWLQIDPVAGGVKQQRANGRAMAYQRGNPQRAIIELSQQLGHTRADSLHSFAWAALA
jgi:hypothetical protein